jgi:hypothetical protein
MGALATQQRPHVPSWSLSPKYCVLSWQIECTTNWPFRIVPFRRTFGPARDTSSLSGPPIAGAAKRASKPGASKPGGFSTGEGAICRPGLYPQSTARLSGRWNVHRIDRSRSASSVYIHRAPGYLAPKPSLRCRTPSRPEAHAARSHTGTESPSAVLVFIPKVLRVFLADGMYTELTAPGVPISCTFIVRPVTRYWNRPSPRARNGSDLPASRSPGLGGHLPSLSCSPKYCASFRQMECTQNWHPGSGQFRVHSSSARYPGAALPALEAAREDEVDSVREAVADAKRFSLAADVPQREDARELNVSSCCITTLRWKISVRQEGRHRPVEPHRQPQDFSLGWCVRHRVPTLRR